MRPAACSAFAGAGFGQHKGKFIAAVARRRVNGSAAVPQHVPQALDGSASRQVAVLVVDLFQAIEIEEQHRELSPRAAGSLDFVVQGFEQPAMIRKAGERIRSRQPAYLVEELGVVEQRSARTTT